MITSMALFGIESRSQWSNWSKSFVYKHKPYGSLNCKSFNLCLLSLSLSLSEVLFIWNLPDQLRPETHAQVYPHQLQKQLQIRDLGERRCGRALIGLSTAAVVVYSLSWRIQMHFKSERERDRDRETSLNSISPPSTQHPFYLSFQI